MVGGGRKKSKTRPVDSIQGSGAVVANDQSEVVVDANDDGEGADDEDSATLSLSAAIHPVVSTVAFHINDTTSSMY